MVSNNLYIKELIKFIKISYFICIAKGLFNIEAVSSILAAAKQDNVIHVKE
jgi:hypothetical protein